LSRAAIRVVLVRPETAANVGAVARILRNTDLDGLDLVAPGDWRTVECWRTAWGAQDVLEEARVFDSLEAAVAGASLVLGFSGKKDRAAPDQDVREAAAEVGALGALDAAALVFGPEDSGLTRAELALCGRRVAIPAHKRQPSLNLSHAVMVAAYEVFRARAGARHVPRRASHHEKQAMLTLWREGLSAVGALPAANRDAYFLEWQNLFQRADLTPKEVRLMEHLARKLLGRRG
jgi:TrmH family RNA methyltransferase